MLDEVKHVQICVDFLYLLKTWKLERSQRFSIPKVLQLERSAVLLNSSDFKETFKPY